MEPWLTYWVTLYLEWVTTDIPYANVPGAYAHQKQNRAPAHQAGKDRHSHLLPRWTESPVRGLLVRNTAAHSHGCPAPVLGTPSQTGCNTAHIHQCKKNHIREYCTSCVCVCVYFRSILSCQEFSLTCTFSSVATKRCVTLPACRNARPVIGQLPSWRVKVLLCLSLVMSPLVNTTLPSVKPSKIAQDST